MREQTHKKKRIAFVTNFIPPYRSTFYEKLCSSSEFDWLIIHGESTDSGRPAFEGELPFPHAEVLNKESRFGPFKLRWQSRALWELRRFDPDILVVLGISGTLSNWLLLLWALLKGKKRLIWSSGWESQSERHLALRFKQLLLRAYLALGNVHVVYGTKAASYIRSLGIDRNRIVVCYNGLEIDGLLQCEEEIRFAGKQLRDQERVGQGPLFLYVGGLLKEKKVDILLQAFIDFHKEKETSKLWIVGDGPERARLEAIMQSAALPDIKHWGRVIDGADRFFAAADYFVLPGTGGLALNQALFWGLPCVVGLADGTETDLVIVNETGYRFTPDDPSSLFAALCKCAALDEQERRRFGMDGRKLVETRSNVTVMVQTFLAAFRAM